MVRLSKKDLTKFILLFLSLLFLGAVPSFADVIIDNGGTGTSYTGTWPLSGGTSPYGASSLWSRNGTTYTFAMSGQSPGTYEVLMWWSGWPSRATSIPVAINYTGGTSNIIINQQQNPGQWNSLGTFYFNGSGSVKITAANGDTLSTCADAVQFRLVSSNTAPTAAIDSITPSPANPGESVTFTGHGTDTEGTIAAYEWTSSIDGVIGTAASFSTSTLSSGTHTISFRVQDNEGLWSSAATQGLTVGTPSAEVIIDNTDSRTSKTGTWAASGATDFYGTDSVWSRNGATFTWTFTPPAPGTYEVSMWWSGWSSRATSIPVAINYTGGTSNITINQRQNAGRWNSLGTFSFTEGGSVTITAANGDTLSTCADAVRFTLQSTANTPPTATIDSITPSPANPGQSVTFTGHGTDTEGTITAYEWTSSIDGAIGTAASFSTSTLSSGTHTISFRVKDNGGLWSSAVTSPLVVNGTPPSEVIIDNTDSQTSRTGTWSTSAASGYYGTNSVWSRDGATFTWKFTPSAAGYSEVFMWWTTTATRSSAVPVAISHAGGAQTVVVDQLLNAGQWNSLGTYEFAAGTTYNITITSQAYPTSTCADAVRFATAVIGVPTANFSADKFWGTPPLTVQFTDQSLGVVTNWLWDFGDGATSTQKNPAHTYTAQGIYTVSLTVTNSAGSNTKTQSQYIRVDNDGEHIYLGDGYSSDALFIPRANTLLQNMGATLTDGVWSYRNQTTGKRYFIHTVKDPEAMAAALKEEGAHIIFNGHANFGLGATFATIDEVYAQEITSIRYIDDSRFTNFSSDMVSLKVDGVQYGQAYPNWLPVFKDGTSGIMPYTFSEGVPPYNYYLTYRVPGDPTLYRVELEDGSYLQRFPDSATPAWHSSAGAEPDPTANPEYFIVNNDADYNRCNFTGTWPFGKVAGSGYMGAAGYLGYNYQYHAPGTGANTATWTLVVTYPGTYAVLASWWPNTANASNAKYTINYTGGSATVEVDQRTSQFTNLLGAYHFEPGIYTISLNDNANARVIADAVLMSSLSNPDKIFQAEFSSNAISGSAPLAVQFTDLSGFYSGSDPMATISQRRWDLGDGAISTQQHPAHTYSSPGIYTVSLTVTDSTGATDTETKTGFIVVGQTAPLRAQFTSSSRMGSDRTVVNFVDQSSGNITDWFWDFGDGATSTEKNPTHAYTTPGAYTVSLIVSGPDGSNTETETDFVHNMIGLIYADNTAHHRPHFYSRVTGSPITFGKVVLDTRRVKIPDEDLRYSRMFYGSCNSCPYYAGTFQRGIFFCTTGDSNSYTALNYLEYYLRGYTDEQLLAYVNSIQPIHHMLNFDLKPPSLR